MHFGNPMDGRHSCESESKLGRAEIISFRSKRLVHHVEVVRDCYSTVGVIQWASGFSVDLAPPAASAYNSARDCFFS